MAEFAVFGVLAGAKDLPRLLAQQRDRNWTGRWEMKQVSEMTVLVVGLGGIGQEVARRLSALGATVIGTSRHLRPVGHVDRLIQVTDIVSAVPEVDAIVLTLPGTAATDKLIGAEVFAAVKPGTILVNVGRGTVVDEDALLPALRDGRISLAALDVFATEPLPRGQSAMERAESPGQPAHSRAQRGRGPTHRRAVRCQRDPLSRRRRTGEQGGHR